MAKMIQEEFLYKKAYEFSYAAFRIASSLKNPKISELLEEKGISLLNSVLVADYGKTMEYVHSIISIVGFITDSGVLHPTNKEILIRESESISLAIDALPKKKDQLPDLKLESIFSKSNSQFKRQIADKEIKRQLQSEIADKNIVDTRRDKPSITKDEIADKNESTPIKSEIRQSAIIEKLRQIGNCRLNELQTIFPKVSERTLRYDIESLISRGIVERVGSRRSSFYRIKNNLDTPIELPAPSVGTSGF